MDLKYIIFLLIWLFTVQHMLYVKPQNTFREYKKANVVFLQLLSLECGGSASSLTMEEDSSNMEENVN